MQPRAGSFPVTGHHLRGGAAREPPYYLVLHDFNQSIRCHARPRSRQPRSARHTRADSSIDIGNQCVVEMNYDYSAWIHSLPFCSHLDFTSGCCNRAKQKERCHSFLRECWQLPRRALYKLKFISSPSGVLISWHKNAWFR